ncbi:hypothetical protein [Photobacterium minamisatsumaniensis]|uniref:hypothetical protein n=1 Tax=Photobacterium minamisatsumaniensis TaxID=2910233 RepID=UPI003D09FAF7
MMWLEAFNAKQHSRIHHIILLSAIFMIISALLTQWQKVNEKAEQTQLSVLTQTLVKSAASLRQEWELSDKPERVTVNGANVSFTQKGWPIVLNEQQINCQKTWELLSSRFNPVSYLDLVEKKEMRSTYYNSCYFKVSSGNWLALFYENETIQIDSFLTRAE